MPCSRKIGKGGGLLLGDIIKCNIQSYKSSHMKYLAGIMVMQIYLFD